MMYNLVIVFGISCIKYLIAQLNEYTAYIDYWISQLEKTFGEMFLNASILHKYHYMCEKTNLWNVQPISLCR